MNSENASVVYLYELDSVRNSPAEVEYAQRVLFEEIVVNGNRVALSLNQLMDSIAFVSLIRDDNSRPQIIDLFKKGFLRVSLYGKTRTASQYMQGAIQKCLDEDSNAFIFSALPIKSTEKNLLKCIMNVLKFSDLQLLQDRCGDTELFKDENPDSGGQVKMSNEDRIKFLTNYLEMILTISQEELALNPPKISQHSFTDYKVEACFALRNSIDQGTSDLYFQTANRIEELEKAIIGDKANRSVWYKILEEKNKGEPLSDVDKIVKATIDLCYNFTVEDSVNGVLKHYTEEEFEEEFLLRLHGYLDTEQSLKHDFSRYENTWPEEIYAKQDKKSKNMLSRLVGIIRSIGVFFGIGSLLSWTTASRVHEAPFTDLKGLRQYVSVSGRFFLPALIFVYQYNQRIKGEQWNISLFWGSLILFFVVLFLTLTRALYKLLRTKKQTTGKILYEQYWQRNFKRWKNQRRENFVWRLAFLFLNIGLFVFLNYIFEEWAPNVFSEKIPTGLVAAIIFGLANSTFMIWLNVPDVKDSFFNLCRAIWDHSVIKHCKKGIAYNKIISETLNEESDEDEGGMGALYGFDGRTSRRVRQFRGRVRHYHRPRESGLF